MSENVLSHGAFYKISNGPVDYEDISEELYDRGSIWNINYEGTLVFTDVSDSDMYGIQFHKHTSISEMDKEILESLNIEIDESSRLEYSCVWYNGTDSDMSTLTLKEYEEVVQK